MAGKRKETALDQWLHSRSSGSSSSGSAEEPQPKRPHLESDGKDEKEKGTDSSAPTIKSSTKRKRFGWRAFRRLCVLEPLFCVTTTQLRQASEKLRPYALSYDSEYAADRQGRPLAEAIVAKCVLRQRWPIVTWLLQHGFPLALPVFLQQHGTRLDKRRAMAALCSHRSLTPLVRSLLSVLSQIKRDRSEHVVADRMFSSHGCHFIEPTDMLSTLYAWHRQEIGVASSYDCRPWSVREMHVNWLDLSIRFGTVRDVQCALRQGYPATRNTLALSYIYLGKLGSLVQDIARNWASELPPTGGFGFTGRMHHLAVALIQTVGNARAVVDKAPTLSQWLRWLAYAVPELPNTLPFSYAGLSLMLNATKDVLVNEEYSPERCARLFWYCQVSELQPMELSNGTTNALYSHPTAEQQLGTLYDEAFRRQARAQHQRGMQWVIRQFCQDWCPQLVVPIRHYREDMNADSVAQLIVDYCMHERE